MSLATNVWFTIVGNNEEFLKEFNNGDTTPKLTKLLCMEDEEGQHTGVEPMEDGQMAHIHKNRVDFLVSNDGYYSTSILWDIVDNPERAFNVKAYVAGSEVNDNFELITNHQNKRWWPIDFKNLVNEEEEKEKNGDRYASFLEILTRP